MPDYRKPNVVDSAVNRAFGMLVRLGLGLPHNRLLQVRGRRTGKIYSTPVNVLTFNGRRYLVAPRGHTQWSRNADAAGEVTLLRGAVRETVRLRRVPEADKPEILKAYLDRFALTVQRYFPVRAGSPRDDFVPLCTKYPVFELL